MIIRLEHHQRSAIRLELTEQQQREIRDRLAEGMTPEDIANFFGRVADLDLGEVAQIRSAAYEISRVDNQS